MSQLADVSDRFGAPVYFEDSFHDMERLSLREDFSKFNDKRRRGVSGLPTDAYEVARQRFLKLLGKHKLMWQSTNEELDLDVEVSRIYCHDRHEYLAFMRIQPRGFRGERVVPAGIEMVFHVLIGQVVFTNKKRIRRMSRGQYTTVMSRSPYSIRCLNEDQPAYLIFRIMNHSDRAKK